MEESLLLVLGVLFKPLHQGPLNPGAKPALVLGSVDTEPLILLKALGVARRVIERTGVELLGRDDLVFVLLELILGEFPLG